MKNKLYNKCIMCNRKLKTIKARQRGYGECCWKKHLEETNKHKHSLFNLASHKNQ